MQLAQRPDCVVSTAAHPIEDPAHFANPNVVKVVTDVHGRALYFSRAPIPWWRDAPVAGQPAAGADTPSPHRHLRLPCRLSAPLPQLPVSPLERLESLEQLRVLWHGERIAVHVTPHAPGAGVDTPEDLARVRAPFWCMNDEVLYKTVRMTHLSEGACVISFKAVNAARSPLGPQLHRTPRTLHGD